MKSSGECLNVMEAKAVPKILAVLGILILVSALGCASKNQANVQKQVDATRELGVVLMNENRPRARLA